jgi:RNA polymerase sigma factor (sigma-70 family)
VTATACSHRNGVAATRTLERRVHRPADRGDVRADATTAEPVGLAAGWEQFEALYTEHHVRLYRFALLLCSGRRAVAEDAVADTFLLLFDAWRSGRVRNVFAYARQTLLNIVFGQHRRDSVAQRYLATHGGDQRGPSHPADQAVERSSMFEYLEQLPNRQRAAVVLRFYEDMSYEQIATTLEVSIGTAKSHVSAGVQRLRQLMDHTSTSPMLHP